MQYSEQDFCKMRERAIQGAYDMQKRTRFPQQNKQNHPQQAISWIPEPSASERAKTVAPLSGTAQSCAVPLPPQQKQSCAVPLPPQQKQSCAVPLPAQQKQSGATQNDCKMQHHAQHSAGQKQWMHPPSPSPQPKQKQACEETEPCQGGSCALGAAKQNGNNQEDGKDMMLILFLFLLLSKEGADQNLLFSLLYILM